MFALESELVRERRVSGGGGGGGGSHTEGGSEKPRSGAWEELSYLLLSLLKY